MDREDIFRELRKEFGKEVILEGFLNTIVTFLSLQIVFTLFLAFQNKIVLSFAFSLIYLIVFVILKSKQFYLNLFEKRVPELREALRTAYEYKNQENTMISGLFSDIWRKLKQTSSGEIVSATSVVSKMIIIAILSFASISLNFVEISLPQLQIDSNGLKSTFVLEKVPLIEDESIYGERSLFSNANESIDLQIEAFKNVLGDREKIAESRVSDYKTPRVTFEDQDIFEEKHVEDFELVKKYNELLKEKL